MKTLISKTRAHHLAILAVAVGLIWTNLHYKFWNDPGRLIVHDVILYYEYLPATFIHQDLSLKFAEKDPEFFQDKIWGIKTGLDRYASKMTMGVAVMQTPFFLAAHALSGPLGHPADGYSPPYRAALAISSVIYALLGLWLLSLLLLRYFRSAETALTLLIIGLGTNLYFYTTLEPPMSHSYSFFLFAAFLLAVDNWVRTPDWRNSMFTGLILGLIALVRPSNGIILLALPFWQVGSLKDLAERLRLFIRRFHLVAFMAFTAFLVFFPQMIYWNYVSGNWFFYGYGEERFFFGDPEFIKGLFSYRKGWLVYTPVMILSLAGLLALYKGHRGLFWPVAVFTVVNMYIVWSWWCWWYGGGFGQRALIESYAVLSLPLAAFSRWALRRPPALGIVYAIVIAAFISLNIFQTRQYYKGVIHWDGMTRKAYWNTFFRTKPAPNLYDQIASPDYSAALKGDR
jgi:hypothetical protein